MMLVPWKKRNGWVDPFYGFGDLQKEINQLFDWPLAKLSERDFGLAESFWSPAIDVSDEKDHLVVKADLPGLTKDEINVSIDQNTLILKGEKKQERREEKKGYVRSERFYGSFYRAIPLPAAVDETKIKAVYQNGVLELTLPKTEEAQPKRITIE